MYRLGIEFLDNQIGEVLPGLIVLHENVGAGGREFAVTSLMNNAKAGVETNYIAVAKTDEEVRWEIANVFPSADTSELLSKLRIFSLAKYYFKDSIVPIYWIDERAGIEVLKGQKNVLVKLVDVFNEIESGIVFLDSLTDLARASKRLGWENLIDLVRGLRSICVKREVLLMCLLTAGVLERGQEEELLDQADAVIVFEWTAEKDSIMRWMYFRKFLGVLPKIESERIVKYNVKIDPAAGFTISRVMRVL